jgi:hypothetical protein
MVHPLIDISRFSHLFYFIILGILFPSNYIGALVLAIGWELFEECITTNELSSDLVIQHFNDYQNIWNDNKNKYMSLGFTMLGYYVGNKLRGVSPL